MYITYNPGDPRTQKVYFLTVLRDFYVDKTPVVTTPDEIVKSALAFADRYAGVPAKLGCIEIGSQITSALGVTIPNDPALIELPIAPVTFDFEGTHWTAILPVVTNWGTLLRPGDVVFYLKTTAHVLAPQHMFTVVSVNGETIDIVDNGPGYIGRRSENSKNIALIPASVTIWRLNQSYASTPLSDRVFNWLEAEFQGIFRKIGAIKQVVNEYSVRQYSTGWTIGTKNNLLYVFNPTTNIAYELGSIDKYILVANSHGF